MADRSKNPVPSIIKLSLQQYKSIESCDIDLGPLAVLVGRNGVGKSNVLDALSLVTDALKDNLEFALRKRGGIFEVRRRAPSKPTIPYIGVEVSLPDGGSAQYGFGIETHSSRKHEFSVRRERCRVLARGGKLVAEYTLTKGVVDKWTPQTPSLPVAHDRLYLVAVSGLPEFRPVYDVLTRMVFHNLNPEVMKLPRRPEPGTLLLRDGSNLASVVKHVSATAPDAMQRVVDLMAAIGVPVTSIAHKQAGSLETIEVSQGRGEGSRPATFEAISLSDGTIRALGILISLMSPISGDTGPSLIGIEEPETALHPAAAGAMMDALIEGSQTSQVIVTCHSPDLLDHPNLDPTAIRVVGLAENGSTTVAKLNPAKIELVKQHLTTSGELLKLDQLDPDPADLERQRDLRGTLWEPTIDD